MSKPPDLSLPRSALRAGCARCVRAWCSIKKDPTPPVGILSLSSLYSQVSSTQLLDKTLQPCARAYDRAAVKFRGAEADINFDLHDYDQDMKQMAELSKEEFVHVLRRQSTGFARSTSKYRGAIMKYGRPDAGFGHALAKSFYPGMYDREVAFGRSFAISS
ncbi:unnamed protein product [Rhodiola kirilowii]